MIQVGGKPMRPPSRKVIRSRLKSGATHAIEQVRKTLAAVDSKVSLALDCWTSRTGHAFLGM